VRAPEELPAVARGALAAVAPLDVVLPPAQGEAALRRVVGERAPGLGMAGGPISLTEDPGHVVWRVVAGELRAAGHRVAERGGDAAVELRVREFRIEAPRHGSGWKLSAHALVALRVARTPGAEDHTELVYTAERETVTYVRPTLANTERVLGECLADLARLVSERDSLARALEAHAQRRSGG
jgi:hypothetical protein